MSAIISWNDPGETPCCCEQSCNQPIFPTDSSYRDIALTAAEYVLLLAGGTLHMQRTNVASVTAEDPPSRLITTSGTHTQTIEAILNNATIFPPFRGTRCDQNISFTQTTTTPQTSSYTLRATDIVLSESQNFTSGSSNEILNIAVYNNGSPNQYGAYIRKNHLAQIQYIVEFKGSPIALPVSWITAANVQKTMDNLPDNSTWDMVLPTRTINIPMRLRGTISFSAPIGSVTSASSNITNDTATFIPSAP